MPIILAHLRTIVASILICFMMLSFTAEASNSNEQTNQTAWQQLSPSLRIGGSARYRYENKENFQFGAPTAGNNQDYWLQQLRLHMLWQPSSNVSLFIEAQDARIFQAFSGHVINNRKTPNIFEDHLDIHQAYLDITTHGSDESSRIRIGRQKFNLGALRMIASLEWVNTARVWDGIRMTSHFDKHQTLDVFSSRLVPVNPTGLNNHKTTKSRLFNSSFHGIYYTNKNQFLPHTQFELYGLLREEATVGDRVFTWGSRAAYKQGAWDADYEVMLQTGSYGNLTQRAYALHFGAGYTFDNIQTHVSTAYNFGSGDDNAADNTHQTFDNQYPLNHAYYGYMDFFSLQNMHNIEIVTQTNIAQTWKVRMAWQGFWLAKPGTDAWYNAGAGITRPASAGASHKVGDEIDITLKHTFPAISSTMYLGYSHFFTGAYIAQTGSSKDADFIFTQIKSTF
ncbi:alginate export family protein [Mariprofundus ferrooxydans]|nr:alginate export family protein [Mariprofundus ferrooxydans]